MASRTWAGGRRTMFRHVVLFTWKDDATAAQKQALHDELANMPPAIDAIRAYKFGPDAGIRPANCDYAVVAAFDDRAGDLASRDHPVTRPRVERSVDPIGATPAA